MGSFACGDRSEACRDLLLAAAQAPHYLGSPEKGRRGFLIELRVTSYESRVAGRVLEERGNVALPWSLMKVLLGLVMVACGVARAETGAAAWLRYAPVANQAEYAWMPSQIALLGDTSTDRAAAEELRRGLTSMLGRTFTVVPFSEQKNAIVVGSITGLKRAFVVEQNGKPISGEEFRIERKHGGGRTVLEVFGGTPQSELFAVFHLLAEIAEEKPIPMDERQAPSSPVRWVNQWDNLDGSIERGYAGRSIFFEGGHVRADLTRAGEYARLLASVGINGCTVNNVNADLGLLTPEMLREFARIADAFRPWGVRLSLAVDLSSPKVVGGLETFRSARSAVSRRGGRRRWMRFTR